jgi:hypothetical protein
MDAGSDVLDSAAQVAGTARCAVHLRRRLEATTPLALRAGTSQRDVPTLHRRP